MALLAPGIVRLGSAADAGLQATSVVRADSSSGRLVRKVVVPRLPAASGRATRPDGEAWRKAVQVDRLVEEAARRYNVDPLLIHSVIQVESDYNPFAVSEKGALGLMQLIPATAKRFGVSNWFNARQNIDAGVRYLKYLQDLFQDDRLALAAYNAGEGAVVRNRAIPPYRETRSYVRKVGEKYEELKKEKAEKGTGNSTPDGSGYRPVESFIDSQGRLILRTR